MSKMLANFLGEEFVRRWSSVFGALSHPARLAILLTLYEIDYREGKLVYLNELCEAYEMSEPLMLWHLKKLEDNNLVEARNAKEVGPYYRVYGLREPGKKLLTDLGLDKKLLEAIKKS